MSPLPHFSTQVDLMGDEDQFGGVDLRVTARQPGGQLLRVQFRPASKRYFKKVEDMAQEIGLIRRIVLSPWEHNPI